MREKSRDKLWLNIGLDRALVGKLRDLVYWIPGETLSTYVEDLLLKHITEYELENGPIDIPEDFYFSKKK